MNYLYIVFQNLQHNKDDPDKPTTMTLKEMSDQYSVITNFR
jgi:hypothetical protein